jgi:hypothetical protein
MKTLRDKSRPEEGYDRDPRRIADFLTLAGDVCVRQLGQRQREPYCVQRLGAASRGRCGPEPHRGRKRGPGEVSMSVSPKRFGSSASR